MSNTDNKLFSKDTAMILSKIRKHQSYKGLCEHLETAKQLKEISQSISDVSEDKCSCIGNIIARLNTLNSTLGLHIGRLKELYTKEGEFIKEKIYQT